MWGLFCYVFEFLKIERFASPYRHGCVIRSFEYATVPHPRGVSTGDAQDVENIGENCKININKDVNVT